MPIFACLALAAVPAAVRHDIEELHRKIARGIVEKDYSTMSLITTDRFTPEFAWRKVAGKEQGLLGMIDGTEADYRNAQAGRGDGPIKYAFRLSNWRMRGETLTLDAYGDVVGEWLQGTYRMPVAFKYGMHETWVRRAGIWTALRFDEVWCRGKMGSKPFVMKAKG